MERSHNYRLRIFQWNSFLRNTVTSEMDDQKDQWVLLDARQVTFWVGYS